MDAPLWKRIGELFEAALKLDGPHRVRFLKEQCGDNEFLLGQVQSLLNAHEKQGPLDSAPTVSALTVPEIIAGRFRIIRYIADGGMGTVYEAEDLRLNDHVALKTIRADIASNPKVVERFKREILLGKKVTHPNVCRIHDLGVDRTETGVEFLFLTMQFLNGETLASRIKRGPIPQTEALPLIEDMADALSAAHLAEVIHRDFKSGNVMLVNGAGRTSAVVTDFGLARGTHDDRSLHAGLVGTVDYMAPEQIKGEEITPASDIYALGIVMYEMVTGQRPFTGDSKVTIITKHIHDEPRPPRNLAPHLDPNWNEAILHCLRKNPCERFQSATEVKLTLSQNGHSRRRWPRRSQKQLTSGRLIALSLASSLALLLVGAIPSVRHTVEGWLHIGSAPHVGQLAVLPFRLDGAQSQQPALFDALTDTLTTELKRLTAAQPVGIIPFGEVVSHHVSDMQQAHDKLGADLALEGHIVQDGDHLQVNLALSEIPSHTQLRAEAVSGTAADFKQLEADIVDAAIDMLEFELHKDKPPGDLGNTTSSEAYQAVTRGQDYLSRNPSQEDNSSARAEFTRALELDPGYAAAYSLLGRAYWADYQLTKDDTLVPKIKDACTHALKLAPSSAGANTCSGVLEEATGHYEQAAAKYQLALDADPTDDFVYHHLGQAYEHLGRLPQAEQTYQKAIQLHAKNAGDYTWLGALYNREARYSEAAVQFHHAVELDPDNAGNWSRLGGTYFFAGDYPEAEVALSKAIALQPSAASWSNLGETYFLERKFEDAIKAFQESTALGGKQSFAYSNLARTYYWYPPTHNKAKPALNKAIELAESDLSLNQNDVAAHTFLAEDYAMLGDKKDALSHLEESLRLDPSNPETFYFAGKVYNLLGDRKQALRWLEKSVRAGYSPAEISHTIELDSLRGDRQFQALSRAMHS